MMMTYTPEETNLELEVEFDYTPAQAETRASFDGPGEPGFDAEASIVRITLKGMDITAIVAIEVWEEIEEAALDYAEGNYL